MDFLETLSVRTEEPAPHKETAALATVSPEAEAPGISILVGEGEEGGGGRGGDRGGGEEGGGEEEGGGGGAGGGGS